MFRLPKVKELDLETLDYFIGLHRQEVFNRYEPLHRAYTSDHDILYQPKKPSHKPDNRIVANLPKYIVDTMNGFFIGNPIKIIADDAAVSEYVEYLDAYNDQDDNNAELSKLCSIFGKGYEMYYADDKGELCITYLSPVDAFMIFDDSIVEKPLYFVRRYTDWEGNEFGSVSNSGYVRHFQITGGIRWTDEWKAHNFEDVPATEYIENDERMGIYEGSVLSMVNAFNKAISEKANDVDYFADAYMKILGALVEKDDISYIRDNRVINMVGENSEKVEVDFMAKPSNDAGQENLLNRLERLIFQVSMVANISDENFGASSGIALKYKLQAMSNLEKTKERKFTSGMNRRYRVLFSHPTARLKVPADAWIGLKFVFTPNFPANMLEETQIAAQMEGVTSHETQLSVLSIVDNVQEELKRIEEENKPAETSPIERMMFGNTVTEENSEADAEEVAADEQ